MGLPARFELVILPDIEKRLEAFVRFGHGFVVFPGGAGTAEEILYLLGILLNPANGDMPFHLVFTGPAGCYPGMARELAGLRAYRDRYGISGSEPAETSGT